MKIYTKTGDAGETSLLGGLRLSKAHLRVEVLGTLDELNAWIGLLRDQPVNESRRDILYQIQDRLFTLGAYIASVEKRTTNGIPQIDEENIKTLETEIDAMEAQLEPLRAFILPGGHTVVSYGHLARAVARRAERTLVHLSEREKVSEVVLGYINRLSDYLFVLCRAMGRELNTPEITWKPEK